MIGSILGTIIGPSEGKIDGKKVSSKDGAIVDVFVGRKVVVGAIVGPSEGITISVDSAT
jgi:hypothetical protein